MDSEMICGESHMAFNIGLMPNRLLSTRVIVIIFADKPTLNKTDQNRTRDWSTQGEF